MHVRALTLAQKDNTDEIKRKEIEVGYVYPTTKNQYRAVLAMKGEIMIYAPSSGKGLNF